MSTLNDRFKVGILLPSSTKVQLQGEEMVGKSLLQLSHEFLVFGSFSSILYFRNTFLPLFSLCFSCHSRY